MQLNSAPTPLQDTDSPSAPYVQCDWLLKRQGANHQILTHRDTGGRVTIPRHPNETLKPKTLQTILDQAGLSVERLRELL